MSLKLVLVQVYREMELAQILEATLSPDTLAIQAAAESLEQAATENLVS